jgi:uncharacterized protein
MIAYFDASAVVPLVVSETATTLCERIWDDADRCVSVRLLYPEARAALARARRLRRLTGAQLKTAIHELDVIVSELDHVEVTADRARAAGELAEVHALRGDDAVHLAAAVAVSSSELVFVTGDGQLAGAARSAGLVVAATG